MDKKIHILHVIENLRPYGGTPVKLLYQVSNSSPTFKFTVCCVVSEGELAGRFRERGNEVIVLNRERNYDLGQIFDIMDIIKTRNIDIVHTHFARSNTFGRIAAILTGKPMIVSEHGMVRNSSLPVFLFDNLLNLFTAHLVANSHGTLRVVQERVFLNRRNMSIIYNGVPDMVKDYLKIPKEKLRLEYGFNADDFIILNAGSHVFWRNHETLIEAVAKIRPLIPSMKVVQAGDGKRYPTLVETVRKFKLDDIFFFWGNTQREKILRFMPAADIYVNAALLEGFGIATVEAMLCELPVVCANAGSLPELVTHDIDGLLFEPKDVEGLSQCILSLYHSESLRKRLGQTARKKALGKFNIQQFVNAFEKKYLSVTK